MNFNWFKQASQALSAGVSVASVLVPALGPLLTRFAPAAGPVVQNLNDELPGVAAILLQIQSLGDSTNMSGEDKIRIAVPFVSQVVLRSPLAVGKNVADKEKFQAGVVNLTEGVLDILKSFEAPVPMANPTDITQPKK